MFGPSLEMPPAEVGPKAIAAARKAVQIKGGDDLCLGRVEAPHGFEPGVEVLQSAPDAFRRREPSARPSGARAWAAWLPYNGGQPA
jgi:hypothetical protein